MAAWRDALSALACSWVATALFAVETISSSPLQRWGRCPKALASAGGSRNVNHMAIR